MSGISESEVAVYDRQLRLWGVQAQQRLLKSKVLVWGLEGSSIEVCKNLVLAGVSLIVRDHRNVEKVDVGFNFLLLEEDLGKNRASCIARGLREMNPLCVVTSSAVELGGEVNLRKSVEECDFLCLSLGILGWNFGQARKIDDVCREMGKGFALTVDQGEVGFFFLDLKEHTVEERSQRQGEQGAEAEVFHFPSLGEWLECSPIDLQQSRLDVSFLCVALLASFLQAGGVCDGTPQGAKEFRNYCKGQACSAAISDAEFEKLYMSLFWWPLAHVAATIGGLLSQEVIKAITKRDPPLVNCVSFNAHTSAALVEQIPAVCCDSRKRKVEETFDIED